MCDTTDGRDSFPLRRLNVISKKRFQSSGGKERFPQRRTVKAQGSATQNKRPDPDALYHGVVRMVSPRGAHVELKQHPEGSVFIPREELGRIKEGQRVTVRLEVGRKGRVYARLVAKGERKQEVVGIIVMQERGAMLVPEPEGPALFIADENLAGAKDGDAVHAHVLHEGRREAAATAEVIEVLGRADDPKVQVEVLVRGSGLPQRFTEETLAQAEAYPDVSPEKALADPNNPRKDLRNVLHVTIDGEDARDFDDAVAASQEADGIRIWVSIADVSAYVTEGSPLDKDAIERGTSVYFPDRVIPMLPERLSNGLCSLRPNEPRLAMTCEMLVDANGNVSDVKIYASLIQSAARLTYNQVQEAIDKKTGPASEISSLPLLLTASRALRKERRGRGSIDLDIPEAVILMDQNGVATHIKERARLEAHKLIEDLMVAANEAVARFLEARSWPTLYRIHPEPDPTRLIALREWAQQLGLTFDVDEAARPKTLSRFLETMKGHKQASVGQTLLLRSMAQAQYSDQNIGHYGLASRSYLHFTSPIRRYPDLIVHRALRALWHNEGPLEGLDHTGERNSSQERRAMEAERSVKDLMACHVAEGHLGEHFEAVVTGVHMAGAFVRTKTMFLEGLLGRYGLSDRTGDAYELKERQQSLVARRSGHTITLGDVLEVRLSQVNTARRQIAFELLRVPKTEGQGPRARFEAMRKSQARGGEGPPRSRGRGNQPAGNRNDSRPGARTDARPGARSDSRPGSRPGARTDSRPGSRPGARTDSRPGARPGGGGGKSRPGGGGKGPSRGRNKRR